MTKDRVKKIGAYSILTIMGSPLGLFLWNIHTEIAEARKDIAVNRIEVVNEKELKVEILKEMRIMRTDIKTILREMPRK
jgi:hypothetical protein